MGKNSAPDRVCKVCYASRKVVTLTHSVKDTAELVNEKTCLSIGFSNSYINAINSKKYKIMILSTFESIGGHVLHFQHRSHYFCISITFDFCSLSQFIDCL